MPLRLTPSFRSLLVLLTVASFGLSPVSASARTRGARHRGGKIHSVPHTFLNVAIPAAGMLPESEDDIPDDDGKKYELKLLRNGTGDTIDVVYRIDDVYMPDALMELNHFLRDSHNQLVSFVEPRTFDVLHTLLAKLGKTDSPIEILSGFRSLETNNLLRASGTTNAAEHSQHTEATAIDLRVPGVSANLLRDAAKSLGLGGVGYYPSGNFIHVDTGPVREWTFAAHHGRVHKRGRRGSGHRTSVRRRRRA